MEGRDKRQEFIRRWEEEEKEGEEKKEEEGKDVEGRKEEKRGIVKYSS